MKSILNKIQRKEVITEKESLNLYRLGLFGNSMFELVELDEKQNYDLHVHHNSESRLYIVIGKGIIILNDKEKKYNPGDDFIVEKGMSHGFKPKSKTLMLSINTPPILNPETEEMDFEYIDKK